MQLSTKQIILTPSYRRFFMRKTGIFVAVFLILITLATESHSVLSSINKWLGDRTEDWFLSPTYHFCLQIKWYLKMNFDTLLVVGTYFLWAVTALKYSRRLFFIVLVFFFYHFLDLIMFWWNYKSTWEVYWGLCVLATIVVALLFVPIKEKGRIVSMK